MLKPKSVRNTDKYKAT